MNDTQSAVGMFNKNSKVVNLLRMFFGQLHCKNLRIYGRVCVKCERIILNFKK